MSQIHAKLKRLHSPDVYNLETYEPQDLTYFGFLVQAMFGPDNAEGEESFDVIVCTPDWIEKNIGSGPIYSGQHHLIMISYRYEALHSYLERFATTCTGDTWTEVALLLSRIGHWEFEGYAA